MADMLLTMPAGNLREKLWHVIIETPRGSCNKYKYEEKLHTFSLATILPEGLSFPYDFGYLPSTRGEDGDPLDVLVLMDQPTFPGCMVPSRLIGIIEGEQTERDGKKQRNDRLIAVPLKTRRYSNVKTHRDLDKDFMSEIGKFFATYNEVFGKKFKVLGIQNETRAEAAVKEGMRRFSRRKRSNR